MIRNVDCTKYHSNQTVQKSSIYVVRVRHVACHGVCMIYFSRNQCVMVYALYASQEISLESMIARMHFCDTLVVSARRVVRE